MDIVMPKLGLTMTEGTVTRWLKDEGEAVEKGEPLFEFETDKSTLEVESPVHGVLRQILAPVGTTVPVLQPVARITEAGEEKPAAARALASDAGPTDQRSPHGAREASPVGAVPNRPRASPKARRLAEASGQELTTIRGTGPGGRIVAVDVERALVEQGAGWAPAEEARHATEPIPAAPGMQAQEIKATPVAQRLAEVAGLDLAAIQGTGPEGRIVKGDLEAWLGVRRDLAVQEAGASSVEVTTMAGIRAVIARRMAESAHTTAATCLSTQADATELVRLRETMRAEWQAASGLIPSFSDLLVVVLAKALREFPKMNAHLVDDEIRQFATVNVGLAVDTERGLLVPVLKGAERMTLSQIAHASRELVTRARDDKLLPDELSGGTFTLTNMGMFEIDAFAPIINIPEVAILGMGRIVDAPAVIEGRLCVRKLVTLSLTFDHRAVDGAPAARFLQRIRHLVEQPYLALAL